jgi:hypothetical protein
MKDHKNGHAVGALDAASTTGERRTTGRRVGVLLPDGKWHGVLPGTFRELKHWGPAGVAGFEFHESESGGTPTLARKVSGPSSSILAFREELEALL